MIAGSEMPGTGQIIVDGRELNGPSRSTSIVFQDNGLFPWQTVRANVEFNVKARGIAASERRMRAEEMPVRTALLGIWRTVSPRESVSKLDGTMQSLPITSIMISAVKKLGNAWNCTLAVIGGSVAITVKLLPI
jgi:ABC-type taurine transport system ATPase subunit